MWTIFHEMPFSNVYAFVGVSFTLSYSLERLYFDCVPSFLPNSLCTVYFSFFRFGFSIRFVSHAGKCNSLNCVTK